ncbi:MAG TPA: class I SAM-dependent methyltransferase [Anaerolineales bacterium]|nr:class I SAM-dependent methyltransferase [Anaerolineales bacterium]
MENVTCNLCNDPRATLYCEISDYLMERDEIHATYVKCANCGLIYQNPRPTIGEINTHYPPNYDSYQEDLKPASKFKSRFADYGIEKRCRIINAYKYGGRLLDVGCATGKFLKGMQRFPGWELFGVELNAEAANIARRSPGLEISTGTLEETRFPTSYFDAITLWDVLEHLHDPKSTLVEIKRILKPDGILVFRIPNGGSWDARLFGKYWFGMDAPRHLYVFDVQTISDLLQRSGFNVIDINCKIGSSVSLAFNLRFWMTGRRMPQKTRRIVQQVLTHPISQLLTLPITGVFDRKLEGSLITVIAVKRSEVDDRNPA